MSKFHINKHGVPAPCKATKGNCPLGGEGEHFDSFKEAQEQADKTNKEKHGILYVIIGGKEDKNEPSSEKVSPFGVNDNFKTQEEAYEYIDKQYEKGYESPLNKKKTSPLSGEGNFESRKHAQSAADRSIQTQYNIDEYYQGNKFQAVGDAMREPMNKGNVKQVLDKGLSEEDLSVSYNIESFLNTPVELKVNVSKVGEDEYKVEGKSHEYSMVEEDFETEEEFNDYLNGGPDTIYDVDFKFSSGELKDTLVSHGRIGDKSTDPKETRGTILAGIYDMSRDNLE